MKPTFDNVISHIEQITGENRNEFANSKKKYVRIFSGARNIEGECVIYRFGIENPTKEQMADPNGAIVKRDVEKKLGLKTEIIKKNGQIIVSYKIVAIAEPKPYYPPTNEVKFLADKLIREGKAFCDECGKKLFGESYGDKNWVLDHKHADKMHLYKDRSYRSSLNNYNLYCKSCNSSKEKYLKNKKNLAAQDSVESDREIILS